MGIQCQIDRVLTKLNHCIPNIQVRHVRGHQDTKKKTRLSWLERLNVRADQLATLERYHLGLRKFSDLQVWFPAAKIQLYLENKPIHKYMPSQIHTAMTSDKYTSYLTYKMEWRSSTYKDIDWHIRHLISVHTPKTRQPWNIKFSCNRLPLYGESHFVTESDLCPVCKTERETSDHFLLCTSYCGKLH